MNILVIGNGFDLAHGLPTTYMDFLIFLDAFENNKRFKKICPEKVQVINDYIHEYLNNNKMDKVREELKKLRIRNFWIKYFLREKMINQCENKGWIDFELEISKFIKLIIKFKKESKINKQNNKNKKGKDKTQLKTSDYVSENINDILFSSYGNRFMDVFGVCFKNTIPRLENDLNNLIRCLEIYLAYIVEKIHINQKPKDIDKYYDKVLSFNYTNTYKKIYDDGEDNVQYDYIHGKVDINRDELENNMVLGIDEFLNESEKNVELDFIRFKKYFQRIYKGTGSSYKKWLQQNEVDNENEKINIDIFGHSLDVTDKDILKELIGNKCTRITIYYYNKEVHAKQIENLVKVIGCDKLIEYTGGVNKKITFIKSNGSNILYN